MALCSYYEPFYPQEWQIKPDARDDDDYGWFDGPVIMGLYRQDSSAQTRIAEAQGTASSGIFITGINTEISENIVLRRSSDSLHIKITGMPTSAPAPAVSKFKVANAERTEKPT